jgi:hypothetical protein
MEKNDIVKTKQLRMANKLIYCLVVITLLSYSCRTIKENDFAVRSPLGTNLPLLQGNVDVKNLSEQFSYGRLRISGYYDGVIIVRNDIDSLKMFVTDKDFFFHEQKASSTADSSGVFIEDESFNTIDFNMNPDKYFTRVKFIPDERVSDVMKLFSNEFKIGGDNIDTVPIGNIKLEIVSFKEKRNLFFTIFSIWTLCIPSLAGVPINQINSDIELQLTIYNSNNEPIGKYDGKGHGTAFIAMYWGYGGDAWRKSALVAVSNAMTMAKSEIDKDKDRLIHELEK